MEVLEVQILATLLTGERAAAHLLAVKVDINKMLIYVGALSYQNFSIDSFELDELYPGEIKKAELSGQLSEQVPQIIAASMRILDAMQWDYNRFPDPLLIKVDLF
jgi:hypothetical protein